ncbi:MAG: HlyC/CorC family transporter [Armatimonadetes bacterium]|jgi:CBS domain containing-hemolysin-like protein|nr:HlyC/CorC family transporter [Armatimonadota bacterium]
MLSPIFSGTEVGFMAVGPTRARHLRDQGLRTARLLCLLQQNRSLVLSTILVVITAANYTAERLAVMYAIRIDPTYGPVVAAVIMTVVVIVFCEVLPIQYGARNPEKTILRGSVPVAVFTLLLLPVVLSMSLLSRLILRAVGVHAKTVLPSVTEDHLKAMIEQGEEQGSIEATERRMLRGVLEFGDYTVAQIMVPRTDMICVEENQTLQEALELGLEHRHSRLPIYRSTPDDIVGILNVKDLLPYALEDRLGDPVRTVSRPAYHVPETLAADELLKRLQAQRITMAIARDEFGGTAGLVTVEDLLEEIVGDIRDEYDDQEEPEIIQVGPGEFLCDARVSLHELENHLTGAELPTEQYESLGGLVMDIAGHLPVVEESVDYDGLTLVIEETEGTRIKRIRVIERPRSENGDSSC